MQPKFFTFMQCTFDDNWKDTPINEPPAERQYLAENMARLRSRIRSHSQHFAYVI